MRYWEIIAADLRKRGSSLGYVSAIDSDGRMYRTTVLMQTSEKLQSLVVLCFPNFAQGREGGGGQWAIGGM